ncbi:ESCRT-0 subunit protein hse1 [Mycoemilia scoparia]|uniref:Class E vacuolar protein-sorting machinery protein HSE1 n=1 Tax=Mycoemilia scoparia TaxID=417184 RepID=A0A9W8A3Z7_9FUNG|nr:ESCRT-0 subunit protein hse1 [Mycoemilia scoparia]
MFRSSSAAEELVKKATDEKLTTENWELIINISDRITSAEEASEFFKAINKRMMHRNANVLLYTLSLVESLVKNRGQYANPEVASRAFTTTLVRVLNDKNTHSEVKKRILGNIQQWAFDFRQDSNLSLMEETYLKLRSEGMRFPSPQKPEKIPRSERDLEKEEEELQLALALSLSDYQSKSNQKSNHIRQEIKRQSENSQSGASSSAERKATLSQKKLKVKALYDFKATESGELGFYKDDVITVLDQKFRDWWKGELRGHTGIFPANFVQLVDGSKASTAKRTDIESQVFSEAENIEILLRKLSRIDPRRENLSENEEIQSLYSSTLSLRPKIVSLIEEYARKKEKLEEINRQISFANQTYDGLMNPSFNPGQQPPPPHLYGSDPYINQQQQPPPQTYQPHPPAQQPPYPQQHQYMPQGQAYQPYSSAPHIPQQPPPQQQPPLHPAQPQYSNQAPPTQASTSVYQTQPVHPHGSQQQAYPASNAPTYLSPY